MPEVVPDESGAKISHQVLIPSAETQESHYDDYLMQAIGMLADRLLADVRSEGRKGEISDLTLTISLEDAVAPVTDPKSSTPTVKP
ncbi:MAG: hypothetical protein EON58_01050 [Alphaproteobacteria bacterium]|nr:MAG: hypothetical protein EON58_01050 [Alphaproteobacteria bacterium]